MDTQWVFLRGLARDQRHWGTFPQLFCQNVGNVNVLCCDLPGAGKLSHLKSPSNISAIVDLIRDHYKSHLLDEEQRRKKVNILAVSLGGMVAADWMKRYSHEIACAVIINSSSRLNPIWQRLELSNFLKLLLIRPSRFAAREKRIIETISNNPDIYPDLTEDWIQFQIENPLPFNTILKQLIAAAKFKPPAITQPTLLLASRKDRLVNPACSVKLAEHWNMPLRWHPTAGHDLTTDDPSWVVDKIVNWMT
ncbi:alpha/beta fold hydrolase [Aurantivibrio plasticivorans]